MTRSAFRALTFLLTLAACSEGGAGDPLGLFGGGNGETAAAGQTDPSRPALPGLASARLEREAGGAILIALARPPRQGYWRPQLTVEDRSDEGEAGTLRVTFRALPPVGPARAGTPASREVTAGLRLSDQRLSGIDRIRVVGADTTLTLRP